MKSRKNIKEEKRIDQHAYVHQENARDKKEKKIKCSMSQKLLVMSSFHTTLNSRCFTCNMNK